MISLYGRTLGELREASEAARVTRFNTTRSATATGKLIDYERPELFELNPLDLAHHLSRQPRWGGATVLSVLDHLALCVRLVEVVPRFTEALVSVEDLPRLRRLVAAHDLHEAILGDVPRPLKALLPDFRALERRWAAEIHHRLGLELEDPLRELVKGVDWYAAAVEASHQAHPEARTICRAVLAEDEPPEAALILLDELLVLDESRRWVLVARALDLPVGFPACRVCGCTDDHGCEEGCWWAVEEDAPGGPICSSCTGER